MGKWKWSHLKDFLRSGISVFVISYVSASTFRTYVGYLSVINGTSMQPTFNPKARTKDDYVFFSTWAIRRYNVKRGDVVALVHPRRPDMYLIKRVIALEGDKVRSASYKYPIVTVPKGHCWIEGDGSHSLDSNAFGPVALGLIVGKASCIVWPRARWSKVDSYVPENRKDAICYGDIEKCIV